MIKFDVKHKMTGEVKFTAEIDCSEDAPLSLKLGLAVKWAIKNGADLSYADLRYADVQSADLRFADVQSADLSYADLRYANLRYVNLRYANLCYANLCSADLSYANLRRADLQSADLSYAKNVIIPAIIGPVGNELRMGYAIWDEEKKKVMVHLGFFYDEEKKAVDAVSEKYGPRSGYAMMVKAACKVAKERKILNPSKDEV